MDPLGHRAADCGRPEEAAQMEILRRGAPAGQSVSDRSGVRTDHSPQAT